MRFFVFLVVLRPDGKELSMAGSAFFDVHREIKPCDIINITNISPISSTAVLQFLLYRACTLGRSRVAQWAALYANASYFFI